jgi:DNA-binding SARP family transcriptional activator/predicted negative regulator of RcsB-dependent stress response
MYSLRFLGGASFEGPSGPVSSRAAQKRELALLAILAAAPQGVTRDKLVGCLWPDTDEDTARRLLSNALYILRREMGEESVQTAGDTVLLNPEIVRSDVGAFQEALAAGNLEEAAASYAGPLLDGFYAGAGSAFEEWLDAERRRLALLYGEALESLADRAEAADNHARAAGWWQRLVAHDPYNSRAVLRLMQALAAAGDRANALKALAEHERLLRDELGLKPAPDVLDLARKLREEEAAPAGRRPVAEAPGPSEVVERRRPLLTRRVAALGLVAVLALVGAIALGRELLRAPLPEFGGAGIPVSPDRIAVMSFEYHGSGEFDYLGECMADMLARAIDGAGQLTTVDGFALQKHVEREYEDLDPEHGAEIARYFGAGRFILGSVIEAGGSFRVSGTLYDLRGGRIADAEEVVNEAAKVLRELPHNLTMRLLRESLADMPERLTGAGAQTTDSLEAMKAYLQGEAWARAGRFDSAMVAYERAVDLDTAFALAYYRLGSNTPGQVSYWEESVLEKAHRFSGRLSWRDSMLVEAFLSTWVRDEYEQGEELYRRVLAAHPDELDAWVNYTLLLGWVMVPRGRPVSDLREAAQRTVALDPHSLMANSELSGIAWFEGDTATAVACWERMIEAQPEGLPSRLWRALVATVRGDPDELEESIEELRAGTWNPIYLTGEWIYSGAGDAPTARGLFEILTEPRWDSRPRRVGHSALIRLELAQGHWRAAEDEIATVSALYPGSGASRSAAARLVPFMPVTSAEFVVLRDSLAAWRPEPDQRIDRLFLLGLLNARSGEVDAAEAIADELEGSFSGTFYRNMALTVRAQAAASQGQYEDALGLLEQVKPVEGWTYKDHFSYDPFERWLRAEVLHSLARYEEALPWYEAFAMSTWEQQYGVPARFRMGQIHERLGNSQMAARYYAQFVERWEDCDPELRPRVDRAQQALERLAGK